ncbi:3-hydroxybutyryl-coA dehydrogenase, putative [Eimeria praecox]|uniref:3-hydroxybutyryl-coA dehydrogenase, putative n=1 Tax=Eimeria praecox TaxID=51316 RepID=U6GYL9_9EIME|nr:3-hydroxybutyryl-coA dehydrogenase, putative [Eimeria praecox]
MGTGIALTAVRHLSDMRVTLLDISKAQLERGRKFSELWVQKEVVKGKLEQAAAESLLERLSFVFLDPEVLITRDSSACPEAVRRSTFCLESASENLGVKRNIFAFLDSAAPPTAVLGTNTSSISITKIASATRSPHRVIGMHFMNPVPVMPLVEIISGLDTDENTKLRTEQLAFQMKKTTAHSLDRPGFVSNRLLMPYLNEAVFALQEGISSAQDIDRIMRLGANMPMGPLELADFIGLDVCLAVLRALHSELGDSKYRPAPLLIQYVDAGYLGRKSGRGFYVYSNRHAGLRK